MKLRISRWYIALAIRVPRFPLPLCVGLGLGAYEARARAVAASLANDLIEESAP